MVEVDFMYRDGDNYKTHFTLEYEDTELEAGGVITMGDHNTPTEDDFFDSEIHPYPYNEEYDRNTLEVVEVRPVEAAEEQKA